MDASPASKSGREQKVVLGCLVASNAINVGFLLFDPRMWHPELVSGTALLAGGIGYVAALPLCWRASRDGYKLAMALAFLASVVVVADNFGAFGSWPNEITYALNFTFFAVQVPLAMASARRAQII
jgi:hypothetical protein